MTRRPSRAERRIAELEAHINDLNDKIAYLEVQENKINLILDTLVVLEERNLNLNRIINEANFRPGRNVTTLDDVYSRDSKRTYDEERDGSLPPTQELKDRLEYHKEQLKNDH